MFILLKSRKQGGLTTTLQLSSCTPESFPDDCCGADIVIQLEMSKQFGPIEQGLNFALGIQGMEFSMNSYESVVCLDREPERPRKPNPEEAPYEEVEDEIQLEKQRHEQLHKDRMAAGKKGLTESDRRIQENAAKVPKKSQEMEESDRRIQSIPQVIQGLPPKQGGNFTGVNFTA